VEKPQNLTAQMVVRMTREDHDRAKKAARRTRRIPSDWARIALSDRATSDLKGDLVPPSSLPATADEVTLLEAFRLLRSSDVERAALLAVCCAVAEGDEPAAQIVVGAARLLPSAQGAHAGRARTARRR